MKHLLSVSLSLVVLSFAGNAQATTDDRDEDGYSNDAEVQVYGTDPNDAQSKPGSVSDFTHLTGTKRIDIDLSEQRLRYYAGNTLVGTIPISSGVARMPTPVGTFSVKSKIPVKLYQGRGYYYPNTKWNMQFKTGYYIHGAYWHNDFGIRPRSHGCVNVSYRDMEKLYAFAQVGTTVTIHR